jgi:hypothetical protein
MIRSKLLTILYFMLLSTCSWAQSEPQRESSKIGFYLQPEYSAMFLDEHVGNAVGFAVGIQSKNNIWDFGIRYYGRSGPINLHQEYELVLPEGETYKGKSSLFLGADHNYLGVEVAYNIRLSNKRLALRIPVSIGQIGAGFYLKGDDRFTPDGRRTSEWEDELQNNSDAGFGISSEFGVQVVYQISHKNKSIHLVMGGTYMNTYGYESFLGGTDFYNNKVRTTIGFRFTL